MHKQRYSPSCDDDAVCYRAPVPFAELTVTAYASNITKPITKYSAFCTLFFANTRCNAAGNDVSVTGDGDDDGSCMVSGDAGVCAMSCTSSFDDDDDDDDDDTVADV